MSKYRMVMLKNSPVFEMGEVVDMEGFLTKEGDDLKPILDAQIQWNRTNTLEPICLQKV